MPRNPANHRAQSSRPRNRCQHITAAGLRCRMLRAPGHPGLCALHAQQEQRFINADEIASAIRCPDGNYQSPVSINHSLGKVLDLLAEGRIPVREATALTYICQNILLSLRYISEDAAKIEDKTLKEAYAAIQAAKAIETPRISEKMKARIHYQLERIAQQAGVIEEVSDPPDEETNASQSNR